MNTTELIARVRRNAFIRDNHPDYTNQVILDELNDALRSIYEDIITLPRQGHWLKQYSFTSSVSQASTRITSRAVVGGLEKVEIGDVNNSLFAIDEVTENHAQFYETFGGRTGQPQYYVIRGDQIDFLPAFDRAMTVRISYYVRPSILVTAQSVGSILTVSTSSVTVAALPVVNNPNNPGFNVGIGTGSVADIVHPNGTFELSLVNQTITNASGGGPVTVSFAAGTDLSEVQVGDYIRFREETDWPPLPEEFHRTVADCASVKVMLQLNMTAKANQIAASVAGDLERLRLLMATPRTRRNPKRIGLSMITFGASRRIFPRFP